MAACSRAAPPADPQPPRVTFYPNDPVVRPLGELLPRPADLPLLDLDPEPVDWRWPLVTPPSWTPSGDLSAMFRTGAAWTTLCPARRDPRGVDRDEALAYLRAWCDLEPGLALAKALAPLVVARTSSIAHAASLDLAALLGLSLGAAEALQWLGRHSAREPAVLDALAAIYLDADRTDDVRLVVKVLGAHRAHGSTSCRRLFRELFVAERTRRDQIRAELAAAGNDAVCARLSAHAHCTLSWGPQAPGRGAAAARIDLERCTPILLERPELLPQAYLTIAAAQWPSSRSYDDWFAFAQFAAGAAGAPRADELIAAAFINAVRTSDCEAQVDQVRLEVARLPMVAARKIGMISRAGCLRRDL